jgi:hypothetical protein
MNLAKAKDTWYVGVNSCSVEAMAESLWYSAASREFEKCEFVL